jgi:hypothetical protein
MVFVRMAEPDTGNRCISVQAPARKMQLLHFLEPVDPAEWNRQNFSASSPQDPRLPEYFESH